MSFDSGFDASGHWFRWGTTLDGVARALDIMPEDSSPVIGIGCESVFGLEALHLDISAPARDRPVTSLCFQLAPAADAIAASPDPWRTRLDNLLGPPLSVDEEPQRACHPGAVVFYARWPAGNIEVGLSIYGALRACAGGQAAGCVWISWSVVEAAVPYLAEWQARCNALSEAAPAAADILVYRLGWELPARFGSETDGVSGDPHGIATNVLYAPRILRTPPSVSDLVGSHGVALWRTSDRHSWALSTGTETVSFGIGETVEIAFNDIRPAKGAGCYEISVAGWSIRDCHGSNAIRRILADLAAVPGVTITTTEGYDC